MSINKSVNHKYQKTAKTVIEKHGGIVEVDIFGLLVRRQPTVLSNNNFVRLEGQIDKIYIQTTSSMYSLEKAKQFSIDLAHALSIVAEIEEKSK